MNTFSKLSKRLALLSLIAGFLFPSFAAAVIPSHLNEDYVLIMSVPFEAPDEVQVTYTAGGSEFERTVDLTEKVRLSISALDLEMEDIPFDLFQTGDGFALDLGAHPEDALSPILGFLSDLSTFGLDNESIVYFSSVVPGSKLGIYPVSDKENPEISIEDEVPVPFVQKGVLRIEFSKQAKVVVDPEVIGEPDEEDDGFTPEAESNGGCSLSASSVATSSAWLALLPMAFAVAMRKRLSR